MVIKLTARNCIGDMVFPKTLKANIPAIAPEVLATGDPTEINKYL